MEIVLRDYQTECIDKVVASYEQDRHGDELLVLPVASGKTIIFSQIINRLYKQYHVNAMVIAHTDVLLDQAAEKYRQVKPDAIIGKIGSGFHEYGGELTIASVATISRPEHIKRLQAIGYGLIVIDEAHRSGAESYKRVLEALPDAFVLKVTATPSRLDGKPISDKPPLYSASIIDMIQQGYLCDVKAIAIRTETNLDDIKSQAGDFKVDELEEAVDTPYRNNRVVEAFQEHASDRRAICFGVTVQHAQNLAMSFQQRSIPAACVSGDTPLAERNRLYAALRTGEIKVLTNVNVLTEGFDLPLVDCVIMARPTQSRTLYIQSIGRGLRLAPMKKDCIILDLTDNILKHRLEPQNLRSALNKNIKNDELVTEALAREEQEFNERKAIVRKLPETRDKDLQVNLLEKLTWTEGANGMYVLIVGREKHRIALVPAKETIEEYTEPFNGNNWCPGCYEEKITDKIQLENRSQLTAIYRCSKCDYWQFAAGGVGDFSHTKTTKTKTGLDLWGNTGYYSVWARLAPDFKAQQWCGPQSLDWAQSQAEKKARMLLSDASAVKLVDRNASWRSQPATEKQLEQLAKWQARFHLNYDPESITKGQAGDLLDPIFEQFEKWRKAREAKGQVAV